MPALDAVASIPLWFFAILIIIAVICGMLATIWLLGVISGKGSKVLGDFLTRKEKVVSEQARRPDTGFSPDQIRQRYMQAAENAIKAKSRLPGSLPSEEEDYAPQPRAPYKQDLPQVPVKVVTKPLTLSKSPAQGEGVRIKIQPDGWKELETRVSQKINYRLGEAAELLGLEQTPNLVTRLLADGEIKSVVTGGGIRWITSESIASMLSRKGITPEKMAAQESEVSGDTEDKQQYKQQYWYYVEGSDQGLPSLRDALRALGMTIKDSDKLDWRKLPAEVRKNIQREKVEEEEQ